MIPTSSNSPQSWHPIFSPYIFWNLIICWPRQRQTTKSKRPSLHSLITLLKRSHDYDWIVESTRDFADTTYGQDLKSRRGAPDSAEWQRSSIINICTSIVWGGSPVAVEGGGHPVAPTWYPLPCPLWYQSSPHPQCISIHFILSCSCFQTNFSPIPPCRGSLTSACL